MARRGKQADFAQQEVNLRELRNGKLVKDLTGQQFGKLTVLRLHSLGFCRGGAVWLCRCECGMERAFDARALKVGDNRSCGCLSKNRKRKPTVERFWGKVSKTDSCWTWTGTLNNKGYGQLSRAKIEGPKVQAHRFSWELHFGPIPSGMCVLHHCDNPPCVRPDHLFLGARIDNTADMLAKGRGKYGPNRPGKGLSS